MDNNNEYIEAADLERFASSIRTVEVETELGKFRVREWRGIERERYLTLSENLDELRRGVLGIVLSLVDGNGELILEPTTESIERLMSWPSSMLDRLAEVTINLNETPRDETSAA